MKLRSWRSLACATSPSSRTVSAPACGAESSSKCGEMPSSRSRWMAASRSRSSRSRMSFMPDFLLARPVRSERDANARARSLAPTLRLDHEEVTRMADVDRVLDRLAAFEPTGLPFLSIYIDARPDNTGRDHWQPIVRKELGERAKTYGRRTAAREHFDADAQRALEWLERAPRASADGIVVFACAGAGIFETLQLDLPLDATEVYAAPRPHLYPLARLVDRYRRYAVAVTDTSLARIFVVALGHIEGRGEVSSPKLRRTDVGGWAQARYQRH